MNCHSPKMRWNGIITINRFVFIARLNTKGIPKGFSPHQRWAGGHPQGITPFATKKPFFKSLFVTSGSHLANGKKDALFTSDRNATVSLTTPSSLTMFLLCRSCRPTIIAQMHIRSNCIIRAQGALAAILACS